MMLLTVLRENNKTKKQGATPSTATPPQLISKWSVVVASEIFKKLFCYSACIRNSMNLHLNLENNNKVGLDLVSADCRWW